MLFVGVADPGGSYGYRASHLAVFGLVGAAVTAFGVGIATSGWGWLVFAVFVVTLVSGYGLDARELRPVHEWTGVFERFWKSPFPRC